MARVAPRVVLPPQIQSQLERLARAPSTPQALALRARLVLSAAAGLPNQQIAATFHVTVSTVGKWRTRFYLFGPDGLTDFQHPGRPPKYGPDARKKLGQLLRQPPPGGKEHWSVGDLAERLGMPRSSVHAMLVAGGFESRRRPARRRPRR